MMSKRSRQEFEGSTQTQIDVLRQPKRRKSETKAMSSEFECPVCYEEFTNAIYQCVEGHLLCHQCRPKFTLCPTCRISLSANIRNRILEQILSTKTHKNNTKKEIPLKPRCNLCNKVFPTQNERNEHYNDCELRKIRCPFIDCKWVDSFHTFSSHAQESHHTSNGISKQSIDSQQNEDKIYTFNHAIKFPKDTLTRESAADFVWPKIVKFNDGKEFFILSRFNKGFITVFVRLIKLSRLNEEEIKKMNTLSLLNVEEMLNMNHSHYKEIDSLGDYWIEFRIKDKNHSNKNKKDNKSDNTFTVPLRWPGNLYGITVPFDHEKRMHQMLSVHHSIFTKYWVQPNLQSSAVLRFQFQAILK